MTPLLATVLGVALAIVIIVLVARSRRSQDTVDSFRRGLDALSPEARKPVVDQVQHHADTLEITDTADASEPPNGPSDPPAGGGSSSDDAGGDDGEQGGRHGA